MAYLNRNLLRSLYNENYSYKKYLQNYLSISVIVPYSKLQKYAFKFRNFISLISTNNIKTINQTKKKS